MKQKPPIPFDEPPMSERFWEPEPYDVCIPEDKGFVTDFILATRGTGVPTIFHLWGAFTVISSLIKREAWIRWHPSKLFVNLYTILVGPPGRVFKSTSVNICSKLLNNISKYIEDPNMKEIKKINIMAGKITPERLLDTLKPRPGTYPLVDERGKPLKKKNGDDLTYKYTSEVLIIASELASLLTKASYNEGMITNLLKLYDCDSEWSTDTFAREKTTLKNMHTTLLAACTPQQFHESIPKGAVNDGFLSRTSIVYCGKNPRKYHEPREVPGGPSKAHLKKSLAWIAENIKGEYYFSKEADAWFKKWYLKYVDELENNAGEAEFKARYDIKLRQLAFLFAAQRYNVTKEISLKDLKAAEYLLRKTFRDSLSLVHEFVASDFQRILNKISSYIESKGCVCRRTLMQNRKVFVKELDISIEQLRQEGNIMIRYRGEFQLHSLGKGDEEYLWQLGRTTDKLKEDNTDD